MVIDEVSRFHFHTRVNHIDSLEIVFVKIGVQSLRLRELTRIESKDTVAIHIVDIHPDDIRGDAMLTQQVGNLHHSRIWLITETTLLIT